MSPASGGRGRGGPAGDNGGLTAISTDPTRAGRFALLKGESARVQRVDERKQWRDVVTVQ